MYCVATIMAIQFMLLCAIMIPVSDDYLIHADTFHHSLLTFLTNSYLLDSGRYTAVFIAATYFHWVPLTFLPLSLILFYILSFLSVAYLTSTISNSQLLSIRNLMWSITFFVCFIVCIIKYIGPDGVWTVFYWLTGAVSYQPSFIFICIFVASSIRYIRNSNNSILVYITCFLAIGTHEVTMVMIDAFVLGLISLKFIDKRINIRWHFLIFLAITAIVASCIMYFAPGNFVRMGPLIGTRCCHFWNSIEQNTLQLFSGRYSLLSLHAFALCMGIFMLIINKSQNDRKVPFKLVVTITIFILIGIFGARMVPFWVLGGQGAPRGLVTYFIVKSI